MAKLMSERLGETRTALVAERDSILAEERDLTEEEEARLAEINTQEAVLWTRMIAAVEAEKRDIEARKFQAQDASVEVKSEANPVYRKGDTASPSYFMDLANRNTDSQAQERLIKSQETRALSSTATAGGTFAPPEWLVDDFVALARPARVTADLLNSQPLPSGVSSINLPKVSTGTAVGITQTQNTAITQTDMATTSLSSGITEITGGQTAAIALLRQSGVSLDQVILQDLALAYATGIDTQVLSGTGANGQLKGLATAGTTVTFTTSAPAVVSATAAASFYNKLVKAVAGVATSRYLPANAIVMTPLRWAWISASIDSSLRPLVPLNGPAFNTLAVADGQVAEGFAGTLAGLPVYVDPNIPQNLGAATNQDQVFVLRKDDHWLWETPVETATFDATLAAQNSIFYRVLGFAALITRYAGSAQVIDGTGLTAPSL